MLDVKIEVNKNKKGENMPVREGFMTLQISVELHNRMRKYAEEKGMVIYRVYQEAIKEFLAKKEQEKE